MRTRSRVAFRNPGWIKRGQRGCDLSFDSDRAPECCKPTEVVNHGGFLALVKLLKGSWDQKRIAADALAALTGYSRTTTGPIPLRVYLLQGDDEHQKERAAAEALAHLVDQDTYRIEMTICSAIPLLFGLLGGSRKQDARALLALALFAKANEAYASEISFLGEIDASIAMLSDTSWLKR